MSLVGAEWVLYLLMLLSIFSVALMFERATFYRQATQGLSEFRQKVRAAASVGDWAQAQKLAQYRVEQQTRKSPDLESEMTVALLSHREGGRTSPDVLTEVAQDGVMRAKIQWDRNLSTLATIGNNAPFVGLFGTVLGIIKAFHDLSQQATNGAQGVTAGVSEALVATAVGILVAIPAVVAFNMYQRKTKSALAEAEAFKSFLIGQMAR
ncbi:MAG: MotA/TolQ/ExbB proton channel family protein [Methylotenera sp.]|nr:MotA/TolQ/ExbB proton channel family protein [Oligoflexia bacterium]